MQSLEEPQNFSTGVPPEPWSPKTPQLLLTPEQAKTLKVKKGYALEPVPLVSLEPVASPQGTELGRGCRNKAKSPALKASPSPSSPQMTPQMVPQMSISSPPVETKQDAKRRSLQHQLHMVELNLSKLAGYESAFRHAASLSSEPATPVPSTSPGSFASPFTPFTPVSAFQNHSSSLPELRIEPNSQSKPTKQQTPRSTPKAKSSPLPESSDNPSSPGGTPGGPDTPRQRRQKKPKVIYEDTSQFQEPAFYNGCRQLIKALRSRKESHPFHEPVNTNLVTDYLSVVSRPMDLSTISQKLNDHKYAIYEEFAADVRLMLSNCLLYNRRDTIYAQYALTLQDYFDSEEDKLRVKNKLSNEIPKPVERAPKPPKKKVVEKPPPPPPPPKPVKPPKPPKQPPPPKVVDDVTLLKQQLQLLQNQVQNMQNQKLDQAIWDLAKPKSKSQPRARKPKPKQEKTQFKNAVLPTSLKFADSGSESEEEDDAPMTYAEKCELSKNISELPGPKIGRVAQIIKERNPELHQDDASEIEIDIDSLDNTTLRHLERYVKSCLAPKKKPTKKRPADAMSSSQPVQHGLQASNSSSFSQQQQSTTPSNVRLEDSSSELSDSD